MNSRALRRLAADHGALHSQPLPPNYLFSQSDSNNDDLTQLDILLAGPTHTPFTAGVWKLHLTIPTTYPQQPPTANFRTAIFHPNVDPQTGGVCVETLKRDWDSQLTLRDVLVTISCLLIQPNPDSALNAEAGGLIQEDYRAFAQRAELMTSIQAAIPQNLVKDVQEAQSRGHDNTVEVRKDDVDRNKSAKQPEAPARTRRAPTRRTAGPRRSDGSPTGGAVRRRRPAPASNPFVTQPRNDDVFGSSSRPLPGTSRIHEDDDSSMMDEDQENDEARSPVKATTPKVATPRRPQGTAVPLGELTLDDTSPDVSDDGDEAEYPPSPRKSPVKRRPQQSNSTENSNRAESSRTATARDRNLTPPVNLQLKPLADNSPFVDSSFMVSTRSPSPRKLKHNLFTPGAPRMPLFGALSTPKHDGGGIFKARSPSSSERKRDGAQRKAELEAKLWEMCGRDVGRWNRCDFDGEPFAMKARRW